METFALFAFVGFLAQLVDGALGMAYGVVASTVMLAFGVPPANVSASVHAAKVVTTAASAATHQYHKNIDKKLFMKLFPAGMIGGVLGAYVLTSIDGNTIRPFIVIYLALMGILILWKSVDLKPHKVVSGNFVFPLGVVGGFCDATGGGGWGPVVTSSLLGAGGEPRYVVGSVNAAEFFVSVAVSAAFLTAILSGHWDDLTELQNNGAAIGGLIAGGLVAAPFAGYILKLIERKLMMQLVGCLVLGLALWQFIQLVV